MTKKKPTLADAGKDIEEGIHQYWDWRHGVDKKLLEHGDRFDEQERRIKRAADYVKEIKDIVDGAIENSVPVTITTTTTEEIPIATKMNALVGGMIGGIFVVLLVFLGLWFYFGGM